MAEAMQSNDVRDYVLDLRKQWPPEMIDKLLKPSSSGASASSAKANTAQGSAPPPDATPDEPVTAASTFLSLMVFTLGLACAVGILFLAIGWPFVQ